MGLFDLPAPLFSAIDGLFSFLPLFPRLLLWSVITAILSMLLYWLCSAQSKVEAAKKRAIAGRREMAAYEGTEFGEMWPLAKESLAASGKHFLIVLVPAILSSLPALTLIIWVSNNFSYTLPAAGTVISVQSSPALLLSGLESDADQADSYTLTWPAGENPVTLFSTANESLLTLPLTAPVPVVHQQQWWNSLIGNPNGYLPEGTSVQDIHFGLPRIKYLNFGPAWAHTWELAYFFVLILCSLGIKVAFKIH
ncbi:MAG: hypothetical protein E2O50_05410 [Gammaproteobacteria bacterium]|nr:MAG: hypothetical protein E2O50_05410 [Gammaproteobacteria bacterium]